MTQTDLAVKADISLIFIQGIEAERKWISPATIKSLAKALQVSESKLFENCFESQPQQAKWNHIPEDIVTALSTTCRHPQWKWEVFRWILDGYKRQISRSPR